jgi:hypothetical protein
LLAKIVNANAAIEVSCVAAEFFASKLDPTEAMRIDRQMVKSLLSYKIPL